MSEVRQFQDLSNGMLRLTTPTCTINLYVNTSQVTSHFVELSWTSLFAY